MTAKTSYGYEYRLAYISDGSIEELFNPADEKEADYWIDAINRGDVEGAEPGDAFKQRRRILTVAYDWESVLD